VSSWGTAYPSWSPYLAETIPRAITFNRNHRFSSNTYIGPWEFQAHDPSNRLTWAQWRAGPYSQDPGSTLRAS
jgi:hypothetical protein